jgi:hypothetical protein
VVPKRTALMLDKMMVALQRALDDDVTTVSAPQPEQVTKYSSSKLIQKASIYTYHKKVNMKNNYKKNLK